MSDEVVRDAVRELLADASWPAGLPFVETENVPQPPSLPDSWSTVRFLGLSDERTEIGPPPFCARESGLVIIVILNRSARGEAAPIALATQAKAVIWEWTKLRNWPVGFEVSSVSPPKTPLPAGDGEWYRIDLTVAYTWDHVSGV
jgi:hypothetical protein